MSKTPKPLPIYAVTVSHSDAGNEYRTSTTTVFEAKAATPKAATALVQRHMAAMSLEAGYGGATIESVELYKPEFLTEASVAKQETDYAAEQARYRASFARSEAKWKATCAALSANR